MANGIFPEGFIWGAATSAYQVEGAVREDGRGESVWDRFVRKPGAIAGGQNADIACDHYHRYPEDIEIMRELGINAYRFSIAWPRVLPQGWGTPNEPGLDFYDRLVDALLAAGIQPCPTLFHWDLPVRLDDAGGWLSRDTPKAMQEYTDLVSRRLGDRVGRWMTVNEPWVLTVLGHALGILAPGHANWDEVPLVGHHLLLAHGWATQTIRENVDSAAVGIGLPLMPVHPGSDAEQDLEASVREDGIRNRMWLDPLQGRGYPTDVEELFGDAWPEIDADDLAAIATPTDYLGLNYYFPAFVVDDPAGPVTRTRSIDPPDLPQTAAGWPVMPSGLTELLVRLQTEYGIETITITENGAAFADPSPHNDRVPDPQRTAFLRDHLEAVLEAIGQGVNVDGYFVWSLLDNFEWASGYGARFGIVHVDFDTQQRTIKDSGRWYARTVQSNELADPA